MQAPRGDALGRLLASHAWVNERRLNSFRAAIWTGVGAITGGAEVAASGTVSPGACLALGWGLIAAFSGATWLRRFYRGWVAALLATMDITVLAACMHAGQRYVLVHAPELAAHQLYSSGVVLTVLLAANVLRYSWPLSLWSVTYGGAAYASVLAWNDGIDVLTYVELAVIALLGLMLVYFARSLAQILRQVAERDSLTRFLPAPVVERVSHDPSAVDLEGEAQQVTALFADIRGFTAIAEQLEPHAVVRMLSEFFAEMSAEVSARGGIVMQYIGDNLYAVFPETGGADHARRALECARAMLRRLEVLNGRRAEHGETQLEIGIGLHSGKVVAGSVGSAELLQYAYVGDTVNTASRIERMTRELDRPLLISSETLERAGGRQAWKAEPMGMIELRGRREALALWALAVPPAALAGAPC